MEKMNQLYHVSITRQLNCIYVTMNKTGMYEDIKAQGLSYQYMEITGKV